MNRAIIAAVCLVVVASAITASVLLVVGQEHQESQAIDGTSVAQQAQKPITAAPAVTPDPTAPPSTAQPTRGALGCVDCRIKGGQALRVTAEDVQLGPDGKYYIPDRGDGCTYREDLRGVWELGVEEVILRAPGCEVFWIYVPATGEVGAVTP